MKKRFTAVIAMLMMLTMAFGLIACGKPSLQEWRDKNAAEFKEIEDSVNNANMGLTASVIVEDNVLIFRYTLADTLDSSDPELTNGMTAAYEAMFDSYQSVFSGLRTQIMDETSTKDVIIRFEVLNGDNAVLYTGDFTE